MIKMKDLSVSRSINPRRCSDHLFAGQVCCRYYVKETQTTAGLKMDHDSMIFLKFNVELRMVFDQASEEIQLEAAILLSPECSVGVQLRVISMRLKAVFF